jgi:ribonuclease VapC
MIVDASAVIAIALGEPDAGRFAAALARPVAKRMSVVNYFEAAVRLDNAGQGLRFDLDGLLSASGVALEPATPDQARAAREAHARYGKGRHPARLNMGDCFAYALAVERGEPLLFKGEDFARTDVRAAP